MIEEENPHGFQEERFLNTVFRMEELRQFYQNVNRIIQSRYSHCPTARYLAKISEYHGTEFLFQNSALLGAEGAENLFDHPHKLTMTVPQFKKFVEWVDGQSRRDFLKTCALMAGGTAVMASVRYHEARGENITTIEEILTYAMVAAGIALFTPIVGLKAVDGISSAYGNLYLPIERLLLRESRMEQVAREVVDRFDPLIHDAGLQILGLEKGREAISLSVRAR